jgi:TolB-like protein
MALSYVLGPFGLDAKAEILFRGAEPVALGQRAVALLCVLVERPGIPVSKDALMDAAWAGLTVEESNLAVQISALRRASGQEPGGEGWIETLPRRGYRFVGPASVEDEGTIVAASEDSELPTGTGAPSLTLPNQLPIAVLPFQNMSGEPEQDYFADGISEDIITGLSRFHALLVIARNSSFAFGGKSIQVQDIARELGVAYVVEGSVRTAGNRVRITAQLIDGSSGGHVWAERYDRALTEIFEVQDEVTGEIVAALGCTSAPRSAAGSRSGAPTTSKPMIVSCAQSLEQFEQTVRLNPRYPPLFLFFMAQNYFALEHYEEAADLLRRRLARQSDSEYEPGAAGRLLRSPRARRGRLCGVAGSAPDLSRLLDRAPSSDPALQEPRGL